MTSAAASALTPPAAAAAAAGGSPLTVRRLLVDLKPPIARHWCGGDAFATAFFNALSMSFPLGEQLFIDSVKIGIATLPEAERARFEREIQDFIGQEATHRHLHTLFNQHLERQGLVNRWEQRIRRRAQVLDTIDPRNRVAVTAATEHFTAIFAEHLLAHPQVVTGAEPRLARLWLWHCAEESEHRSTAFDLYVAMGGNHAWRVRVFRIVSSQFVTDALRQTLANLWRDGTWWRPSTWAGGWRLLFGRQGLVRLGYPRWREYLREDFHPSQGDDRLARRWLADNAEWAPPVRAAA
ncbi:MAG: metal-dependent hydrolase [Rubrivivax sp.]|nr:metal-dependent hydrolase [Rubrivivax sp.]